MMSKCQSAIVRAQGNIFCLCLSALKSYVPSSLAVHQIGMPYQLLGFGTGNLAKVKYLVQSNSNIHQALDKLPFCGCLLLSDILLNEVSYLCA